MDNDDDGSRLMTQEEMVEYDAAYQRRLLEKLQEEGPKKFANDPRFMAYDYVSSEEDEEMSNVLQNGTNGNQRHGSICSSKSSRLTSACNGAENSLNSDGTRHEQWRTETSPAEQSVEELKKIIESLQRHGDEREMLLDVRKNELDRVSREMAELRERFQHNLGDLQSKLTQSSMEKERALVSLKECQSLFTSCKSENVQLFSELQAAKDDIQRLKEDLRMEKMTIAEKDRLIEIMGSHSKENVIIKRLEEELQSKDKRHQAELTSLNDELKKVYKTREDLERRSMELENTVRDLQKRYDEVTTERAETVTRLMSKITIMEEGLEKRLMSSTIQNFLAETRARTDGSLSNELAQMQPLMEALRTELADAKNSEKQMDEENRSLRERLAELQRKLSEIEAEQENGNKAIRDYSTQYMRFHDEEKAKVRAECQMVLKEKQAEIENLKGEIEEVKRLYCDQYSETNHVAVQKLQHELEASQKRVEDLRKTHSEFCQPELSKREELVQSLREETRKLGDELAAIQNEGRRQKEKLDENDVELLRLRLTVEQLKSENARLQVQIEAYEKNATDYVVKINELKEEVTKLKSLSSSRAAARTSVATSPVKNSTGAKPESKSVGTSPETKSYTESEVLSRFQILAEKHEEERLRYESHIADILLMAKRTSADISQKKLCDAATLTSPLVESSAELTLCIWNKLQELQNQNAQLTARTRRSEDLESELSRVSEQYQNLREHAINLRSDLKNVSDKFNKLKAYAKTQRESFIKDISKLNEEKEDLQRKLEKEREIMEKAQEIWLKERAKWEGVLLELRAKVQSLTYPRPCETVDALTKMYDEVMATLANVK